MEYQLIRIDQLPNGTINLDSPIMFGNGQFIEKVPLSGLLALVPAPTVNTKMSLTDLEITVLEADLPTFLSGVSLTIATGDVKLIRFAVIKTNGRLSRFTYGVPLSAGTYASLGNEITFDELILVNEEPITEGVAPNTITYSYPSIEAVNALDPSLDLSDEDFVYILILGGVAFQFIGTNGFYGANDLQLDSEDLQLLTSELLADQDNLPIPIDLSLADLGLTEVGTDEEMNDALKDYFLANTLAVGEKQILDIRIFDEFPSPEPYLRLEFDDITILEDYGVTDLNDVEQWNGFLGGSEFESVEVNGNVAELRGGTTEFISVESALDPFDLIDFDVRNISGSLSLFIADNNTFSLDAIKITNCPNTTDITYNACPENITVLPASISNMPDLQILDISGNVGRGIETIESGALNGCTSLNTLILTGFTPTSGNNLTAAQLDNMANWAENDAPINGDLYLSTEADISGSATIGFLTTKGWTIDNNI
jgi:hypothetical protein